MFSFFNLFDLSSTTQQQQRQQQQQDPADQKRAQIHQLAAYLSSAKVRRSSVKKIVESLRQVAEVIVWCDRRNSPELLNLTLEVGLHKAMLRFLYFEQRLPKTNAVAAAHGSKGRKASPATADAQKKGEAELEAVVTQTLQTFSIVLDGVTDPKYMYLLFSNNFVNDLIAAPVVASLDSEEVLAYYVAFLKALSLRLTPDTIHFFFNKTGHRVDDFPLYTIAIGLFDHPDSMVRVAVRAITLNVLRINDRDATEFILNAPACAYFWEQIVCALRDACDDAFRIIVDMPGVADVPPTRSTTSGGSSWAVVDLVLEKHMGLLAYLNDIYGLSIERISTKITDEFADRIIQRTYVHAVDVGWRPDASPEETLYMQVVSLFIAHFFAIVKHSPLLADAMNALLVVSADNVHEDNYDDDDGASKTLAAGGHIHSSRQPFVPSALESSRTLAPWACIALEVLSNKAISPSALVKSVLTPRRMLRTRVLLDSLTGDVTSNGSSVGSDNSSDSQTPPQPQPINASARPPASKVIVSMVHVLTDSMNLHSSITIDLAALLISELCRMPPPDNRIVIDDHELTGKLLDAQHLLSTELRSMLLSIGGGTGLWKTAVKCLLDFANATPDMLRIKAEAEGKHIFACAEPLQHQNQDRDQSQDQDQKQKQNSPNHSNKEGDGQRQRPASPFDTPPEMQFCSDRAFEAMFHQVYSIKRICSALGNNGNSNSNSNSNSAGVSLQKSKECPYARDLLLWISGATLLNDDGVYGSGFDSVVVDNAAKNALPRSVSKLGISARIACHSGCLMIWHQQKQQKQQQSKDNGEEDEEEERRRRLLPDLLWPLADVTITETTLKTDACELPAIRLSDTCFPQPFYPPRPPSLGGITTVSSSSAARARKYSTIAQNNGDSSSNSNGCKLSQYSYTGTQRSLDISLRFTDDMECADAEGLLQHHALVSRQLLSEILFNHNVI
ncbi:Protein CL16A [Coemansia sp. RSA 1200]|nr:Protein CL16A [Coemansia sp. RSA 1200]